MDATFEDDRGNYINQGAVGECFPQVQLMQGVDEARTLTLFGVSFLTCLNFIQRHQNMIKLFGRQNINV